MNSSVVLGMMAEITMKARILRARLKSDPSSIHEVIDSLNALEADMFFCILEFEDSMAK